MKNSTMLLLQLLLTASLGLAVNGCNVKANNDNQDNQVLEVSSPESQELKMGSASAPAINQFVVINHPGGALNHYFTFRTAVAGRVFLDNGETKYGAAKDCDSSIKLETRRLQILVNGQVVDSIVMFDPRGELVSPAREYRISYEFTNVGPCSKMIASIPAIFTPTTP